ncbi:MAG: PAS domain-containing protein [Patescibacteria group bacterium]
MKKKPSFEESPPSDILYKKLMDTMAEAVWMGDAQERTRYVNHKFCSLTGYSLEESLGQESYVFWDHESSERVKYVNSHDRKNGISSSYEGNVLAKDGRKIPVLLSGTPLPDGGTIGIITDISELKKQKNMADFLQSALAKSHDAVITLDQDLHILSWNQGAKDIFGYDAQEITGRLLDLIFGPKDLQMIVKNPLRLNMLEVKGFHKKRHEMDITLSFSQGDGFSMVIARDVSPQKRFEQELSAKNEKIELERQNLAEVQKKIDAMMDFLSVMSHGFANDSSMSSDFFEFLGNTAMSITAANGCIVRLFRDHGKKKGASLELVSCVGTVPVLEKQNLISFDQSLAKKAFDERRIVSSSENSLIRQEVIAVAPIFSGDRFLASVHLYCEHGWTSKDTFLEKFLVMAGMRMRD